MCWLRNDVTKTKDTPGGESDGTSEAPASTESDAEPYLRSDRGYVPQAQTTKK